MNEYRDYKYFDLIIEINNENNIQKEYLEKIKNALSDEYGNRYPKNNEAIDEFTNNGAVFFTEYEFHVPSVVTYRTPPIFKKDLSEKEFIEIHSKKVNKIINDLGLNIDFNTRVIAGEIYCQRWLTNDDFNDSENIFACRGCNLLNNLPKGYHLSKRINHHDIEKNITSGINVITYNDITAIIEFSEGYDYNEYKVTEIKNTGNKAEEVCLSLFTEKELNILIERCNKELAKTKFKNN